MFTLKLFKRIGGGDNQITTMIRCVDHVTTTQIGKDKETLELRAFNNADGIGYDVYYIGKREDDMDAVNADNHWGWGLLENWEGNTTQHFRPHSYG